MPRRECCAGLAKRLKHRDVYANTRENHEEKILTQKDHPDLAIFINTSDGFNDCWDPFFTLWRTNAGELTSLPIYLNTERVTYLSGDLSIVPTCVWAERETERPTWSTCLQRGLEVVEQTYVLYMQEDYFITRPVRCDWVFRAKNLLDSHPNVDVVYLNKFGPIFSAGPAVEDGFVTVPRNSKYLVSTQAAIWRKNSLQMHARGWENAWMFEKFGSWRAMRSNKTFVSVVPDVLRHDAVMDYIYTGVMKGKWHRGCVDLFSVNGISVDFSKRGFYQDAGRLKTKYEVAKKLFGKPSATLKSLKSLWTTNSL
jgi:hypothetical protein